MPSSCSSKSSSAENISFSPYFKGIQYKGRNLQKGFCQFHNCSWPEVRDIFALLSQNSGFLLKKINSTHNLLLWWKIFDNFLEILYHINLFRGNFIILFSFDICLKLVAVNQNEDWVTVHFLDFDHKHCTSNISNFHIKFNSILQKYHKSKMDEKGWLITKRGEKHKHRQTNSWAVTKSGSSHTPLY